MKSHVLRSLLTASGIACVCLLLIGCRRTPTIPVDRTPATGIAGRSPTDVFVDARDAFRFTRPSDDWTRFRDFLPKLNSYFSKAGIQNRLKLTDAERKFLSDEVHLTSAELAELEAPDFRAADAHFLDECYLLRDAARSLEADGLDTAEKKAYALFRWVNRNVLLHEQVDSWVPPAFTLRRGHGGAVERALVCLALLRQEKLDGFLVVVPDSDPLQFLIGVPAAKSPGIMLFDMRLGLAVAGKDGKGIATLKEARADPKLLAPSLITPEQAKKLEAWLVCPYHALSPRMLELQGPLGKLDRVVLHQNPLELSQEIARLAEIPVKVWNPPAQGKKLANSPTRCLELFLDKNSGGQDTAGRAIVASPTRVPRDSVTVSFGQINITQGLLPPPVYNRLFDIVGGFIANYDLQPRELYLRGQYEAMRQRQERIRPLVNTDAFIDDKEFEKDRADWFKLIAAARGNLEHSDARERAKAQQVLDSLGGSDFLLNWMIDVESEKKLEDIDKELREANIKADHARSMPTKILAVALRDHFKAEVNRSQAAASQEKAERAQANLQAQAKPSKDVVRKVYEAWINAKSAWDNFYLPVITRPSIEQRLETIRTRVRPVARTQLEEIDLRMSLLEALHLDVARTFNAKLRLAECLVHTHADGVKGANAYLVQTKREIEQIETKGLLRDEIKSLHDSLPRINMPDAARTIFQRRLELLSHDWSERGTYFWLKQQIDQRVK